MATSSIMRSAAANPPLDHALSSVRVAAYDRVGPVASCRVSSAAGAASSCSGTTCVAPPPEGDPLHHGDCWHPQHFDGAIGDVYVRAERPEPVDILSRPFPHFAAE